VEIVRTEERDYLFVDMHHIISDGMSSTIFVRELNALMEDVTLPELDRQYKDYSEWMKGQDLSQSEKYWLGSLEDYPVLELQTDHARPMNQEFEGKTEKLVLDEVTTKKIKSLIQESNATEYMFFMGLISILLGKLANQDDLVIGTPVSGRIHRDTESMLGMFVNTLAMRLQPEGEKTFASYLEELKTQSLEAQEHQMYPFEDIVEKLVDSRDASRNPLFDVLVAYQNNENLADVMGSSSLMETELPAKFDLMFSLADDGKETLIALTYATSLFTETTIKTYLERLTLLLDQILADTNLPINQLDAVLDEERNLILGKFNDTAVDFPAQLSIAEQFEAQVVANPDAIAVEDKNGRLTYAELDAKVNGVAGALIDHGLQLEDYVAVVAKRNIDTVIGFLAVLKAGGAYMPIDADYPETRISFMLEDSKAKLVLGAEGDLPVSGDYVYINPSDVQPQKNAPAITTSGSSLAYLIYTSGTTGNPKGVMVEQQSITRLVKNTNYADFNDVRILQTGSLSFDASTFEIWGALLNGGYVFITDMNVLVDDAKLKAMIAELNINTMWLTASLYNHLITVDVTVFDNLDQLLIGGEALSKLHVDKLLDYNSNINLINGYGPTETTTFAVTFAMRYSMPASVKIPIGKPIANTTNYIVTDGKLSGIGVPGELLIGGAGLARGYLNNPDLTTEKFIDNPFGEGKLYRTGDLVSWTPDGYINYLGRFDDQVKIRGHRIELGEIESALRAIDEIDHAVLVVREGQLHAYIQNPTSLPHEVIKSRLSITLPDYMIPTHLMDLGTFPVTANGKVNKRALPVIEVTTTVDYVAPTTKLETIVAQGYQEILEIDQVGLNDDFFQLGGHSLRALRLVNLLEERTGKAIEIRHIFETSKVFDLAVVIQGLEDSTYERIPKAEEKEFYGMSGAQKRMYLLWKFNPSETNYNMPIALTFDQRIDEAKLAGAVNQLTARHEILRTTFAEEAGALVQVISPSTKTNVIVTNLAEADVKAWCERAVQPFNLEEGPMYRVEIARTLAKDYLFVDMHHIISDGMSSTIFVNEINAFMSNAQLPALDRQYKDYSEWLNNQDLTASEDYWLTNLEDYPVLELQTDHIRPLTQPFEGATQQLIFDEKTTAKIKQLINQTNTTEYMFFMGLISILLGKLANQDDLVIGSPVSGRVHKDTESMLGMFVNTLVMRLKPEGSKTFAAYLEELKSQTLEAQSHQIYPFEDLVEKLVDMRDGSRNPLFDVLVVYQNNETTDEIMGATTAENIEAPAKFDLMFNLSDNGKETTLHLTYATSLFTETTIKTYLERLTLLLDQILADTNRPIKELDAILETERALILGAFNDTTTDFPAMLSIAEQFEAQVKLNPTKVAVEDKNGRLTYAELDAKVNGVAGALIDNGLQLEDYVAVVAKRNIDTVVGFLASLKAGGAYMPIDADYPENRINFMLEDSKAKLILGNEGDLPVSGDYTYIDPSNVKPQKKAPAITTNGNNLAYLIYTSGTTGHPKGVMIEQQSITRLVKNTNYADFNDVRILQTGSLSFDASTFEIWGALLNGGYVFIADMNVLVDDAKLKSMINDLQINTMWLTASLYNHLITVDVEVFDNLKQLLIGGEALSKRHVDKLLTHNPTINLINGYGPTETTTFAVTLTMNGPLPFSKIPIGKPIANTTNYIVTDNKLAGIGMPGELLIGGLGLARGYLNNPDLTTEKFIDNPFGESKLYRTGDLVSWTPNGYINYLGRFDDQVKVRGHRIELGEIESALRAIDEIDHAVLVVREGQLHAYIQNPTGLPHDAIKSRLSTTLPDYMIPTHFMDLETFPITANGKVNKRALPIIVTTTTVEYVAPTTELEIAVALGYQEILEVEQIGLNDDFFQLGGHSLRALRLVNLLEERTGKAVEIRNIFETSKVVDLAVVIQGLEDSTYQRIPVAKEKDFYEMSGAQKRMYLLWKFSPSETNYNMPIALTFDTRLDEVKLTTAINQLVDRHEILRTTFFEKEGNLVQIISESTKTNVLVTNLDETEVASWYEDALQPFDLENGPLFRVEIARTPEADHLFVDMHHIISDGMSTAIFVNEMNALMVDMELPALDRQYKDYSEWLTALDLSTSEDYWLTSLEDYPVLELQTDRPRPMMQQFEGSTQRLTLDEVTTSKIKALINQTNSTEYMFFMGLISILLGKLANQNDLVIGSPISGRIHRDTEKMLGMFVNTLAMRLQPEGTKTFASYLEELKAQTLEAQAHQMYPFEDLVEKLVDSRDGSRNPLFDVLVVYQNNEITDEIMGATAIHEVDTPAKFDLMFSLADDGKETFIELTYATSLFNESTIEIYLDRLIRLLDQILADPNLPINQLDATLEAERTLILDTFNDAAVDFPAELSIAEQFEAQVKANPEAIAAQDKNGSLTYAQLDAKANGLAQALIDNGLQLEDYVAIVAKRNIDTVVGFLAVLKAGGAYVPIDADYPETRINFMLEDSKAKIILGSEGDLPVTGDYLYIDPATSLPQEQAPAINAGGNNLAYLIYTSGTTGNPKGVMIEQKSITRLVKNTNYVVLTQIRILQTGSLSFDASTFEIWGALLNGGYVFIADMDVLVDDAKLKAMIAELNINTMWLTASLYNHLITVDVDVFNDLDQLLIGGEALSKLHVDKLLDHQSKTLLINGYGPTETTTFAVTTVISRSLRFKKIPIGRPIANTTAYVMTDGKLAGIDVPGELLIGGPGLARGYLNNPELTAEKFIDNPFGEGKLYRTGDLVSWTPYGHINYLGRMDDQVKIRGHRIELGEIESALRALPEIDHAVLVVREGQLHAYIQNPTGLAHDEIKSRLNATLPDYMIPTHFMDLETFPVTANGKVNKGALPIIKVTHAVEYVAPTTELETIVALGYQEILEVEQVGLNDDFFLLGGHSLRALRLVNLLKERTGKAIEIRHIFETSKVVDLAVVIENLSDATYERIPVAEEKDFYEMSAPQRRMYKQWKDVEQKNGIGKNMPIRMKFKDRLDATLVEDAFEVLVARHEIFRTTFVEQDGTPLQVIHDKLPVHVPVEEIKEADVGAWFKENVKPFDLEKGPIFNIKLARTESHDHLLVDMHHIVSDGRSHNNLVQEIMQIFAGLPLPAIPRQYKDYSEWMNAQDLSGSEAYWLERLDGYQPLQLPTDYPRKGRVTFAAKTHALVLDEAITTGIKAFTKQTGTTEYMFFLALLSILLGKHAKQEDVLIGSVMSGRVHRDTEAMLGVFTNTMGMRTSPLDDKTFSDYLSEIKAETLGAYDHQTYPLSSLPDDLVKKPDGTRDEIFDVLYIYQNNEVTDLTAMGLLELEEYQLPETPELYYTLGDDGKEITCLLAYATELFKPETIQNYQEGLKKLIEQVLADAEKTIQKLEI